jgi:hypothetical protein
VRKIIENLKISDLTVAETLRATPELINMLTQVTAKEFENSPNLELTELELGDSDPWGFGDNATSPARVDLTMLRKTKAMEPGDEIVVSFKSDGSTKVVGLIYDGHGHAYTAKII